MRISFRKVVLLAGALLAVGAGVAGAHDLRSMVADRNSVPPEVWNKIQDIRNLRRFLAAEAGKTQDAQLEGVVQTELTWRDPRLSICFLNGGQQARDHIAEVAARWMEATGLQFDFGPAGNRYSCGSGRRANVRVSFTGVGYWSRVGIEANLLTDINKATLNLEGMNKATFTAEDDGTILHEFGHAIGFEHEHQSPVATCEKELNWDFLYTTWGPSMGWDRAQVDVNMKQLLEPTSKLLTTAFDKESVMLYNLEKETFKDLRTATCYIPKQKTVISALDREAAATVYPVQVSMAPGPKTRALPRAAPSPKRSAEVNDALKKLKQLTDQARR